MDNKCIEREGVGEKQNKFTYPFESKPNSKMYRLPQLLIAKTKSDLSINDVIDAKISTM